MRAPGVRQPFGWLIQTRHEIKIWLESAGTREGVMPHYEYLCLACNKKFSQVLSLAEYEKAKVKCPKCGSAKVEQQWAAFYATTSKKS